jgi:uncharacterized membrane protein YbhN (UPF0104 family)
MKIALSIALVAYAFSKIDLGNALRLMQRISPLSVSAGLGLLVFQQVLASVRLKKLLALMGEKMGFARAADAVFIGVFFGQTFISFLGGDAMRVWRIMSHGISISIAARAVLLDRVAGFMALVALVVIGLPFMFGLVSDAAMRFGIGLAVALGLVLILLFLSMSRLPGSFRRGRVVRLLIDVAAQLLAIARTPRDLVSVLGLSVAIQLTNPVVVYLLARGLGIEARFLDYLVLVPPVLLLAMLPISFAGWGVREGAMVVALGFVGVPAEASVAMSVWFGLALIVIGLPGGVLWFRQRRYAAPPVAP